MRSRVFEIVGKMKSMMMIRDIVPEMYRRGDPYDDQSRRLDRSGNGGFSEHGQGVRKTSLVGPGNDLGRN